MLSRPFWQAALGERPRPSLGAYAKARLTRILPGYVVCLLVCTVLFADRTSESAVRLLTSLTLTNWLHWRTFFPTPVNSPLWSISIELCFYAMLPLWAFGLYRLKRIEAALMYVAGTQLAIVVLQKVFFASLVSWDGTVAVSDPLQAIAVEWLPAKNPLGLFGHFLFGCAAAGALAYWRRRNAVQAPPVGSSVNAFDLVAVGCLILLALVVYPAALSSTVWTHLIAAADVWFMGYSWPVFPALIAVLLVALHYSGRLGALVDNRLLVQTARLSYGIYLWHMVVLVVLKRNWPTKFADSLGAQVEYVVLALAITGLLAAASYWLIEQPVLRLMSSRRHVEPGPVDAVVMTK